MEIVRLRKHGYDIRDIAKKLNISAEQVKADLDAAHSALKELCYEC